MTSTLPPYTTLFFFNDTATTEIYTLSLHDALPIFISELTWNTFRDHLILEYEVPKYDGDLRSPNCYVPLDEALDRKSTRLNSSHSQISYAVFCLKKNTS